MTGLLLLTAFLATIFVGSAGAQRRPTDPVFVSPTGRDTWSGHLPEANAAGTDGPLATLAAAVAVQRGHAGPRSVIVRQGRYFVDQPLNLGAGDAGLQVIAFANEHPTLYGGRPLTGWQRSGDDWVARLAGPVPPSNGLPMLIKGQQNLRISRTPAADTREVHEAAWMFADSMPAGIDPHRGFRVRAADKPALAAAGRDAWVTVFGQRGWLDNLLPVRQIDLEQRIVTLDGTAWDAIGEASRYAFLNVPVPRISGADLPAWRYDPTANTIFLRLPPLAGPPAEIIAATLPCVISIEGGHDMIFAGLGMIGSTTRGAAICLSKAQNITLDTLDIAQTGDGIRMHQAIGTRILHSVIAHTAAAGVTLRHGSDDALVSGTWLHDIGELQQDASAISFDGSSHARFVQNRIENVAKFAIGGGSLSEGGAYDIVIEGNEISHSNQRTSDGGAIMVIGWSQDSAHDVIRGNFVSETTALGNIGWDGKPHDTFQDPIHRLVSQAIYLDDWASEIEVSSNLLCGNIGGIELHAGWNNHVFNNILIGNAGNGFDIDEVEWLGAGAHPHRMERNVIEHNLVMLTAPSDGQSGIAAIRGGPETVHFDHNVYAGPGLNQSSFHHEPDHVWSKYSFGIEVWRRNGDDINSDVGEIAAKIAIQDDTLRVSGARNAPAPLPLTRVGRPEDQAGLADRIRQKCSLP